MVSEDMNLVEGTFTLGSPVSKCFMYSEQFLVVDFIIHLGRKELPGVESDRPHFSGVTVNLRKNACQSIVRAIRLKNDRQRRVKVPEDRGPGEGRAEEFEGGLAVGGPLELLVFSSEGSEGSDDL